MEHDVIVIGAGQAGLAASYYLKQHQIDHIVLERHRTGDSWERQRWDSFMMNTPNWMTQLPGRTADEETKDAFMSGKEFVHYLSNYVIEFDLPVLEQQPVMRLRKLNDYFEVTTPLQTYHAKAVINAAGMMNALHLPPVAAEIPAQHIHAGDYKNPSQIHGEVLIVGAGQSGCQIAEELALAGKKVYLASSRVPRAPRRVNGKDVMRWMDIMGLMDTPAGIGADTAQPQVSGVGPLGHTVSYQSLHKLGVTIVGSMTGPLTFADNAAENVRYADMTSQKFKEKIQAYTGQAYDTDDNDQPDTRCSCADDIHELTNITTIIWATGFSHDFSWMAPDVKDAPGLFSLGFPWLRKKKSGLVFGIDEDARVITEQIKSFIFGTCER